MRARLESNIVMTQWVAQASSILAIGLACHRNPVFPNGKGNIQHPRSSHSFLPWHFIELHILVRSQCSPHWSRRPEMKSHLNRNEVAVERTLICNTSSNIHYPYPASFAHRDDKWIWAYIEQRKGRETKYVCLWWRKRLDLQTTPFVFLQFNVASCNQPNGIGLHSEDG